MQRSCASIVSQLKLRTRPTRLGRAIGCSVRLRVSAPCRAGLSPTLCRSAAHGRTRPPPAGPSRVLSLHSLSLYPSRTNSMPRELGPVQPDAWVELHWLAVWGEPWELANKILGAFLLLRPPSLIDKRYAFRRRQLQLGEGSVFAQSKVISPRQETLLISDNHIWGKWPSSRDWRVLSLNLFHGIDTT